MSTIYPSNPNLKSYTYRIDNLLNDMWYWGVRTPKRWPDDKYWSHSKHVKSDIEKYGIDNFKKTILEFHHTTDEAYKAEKSLIMPDLNNTMCYNRGCWGTYPVGEKHGMRGKTHTEQARKKQSLSSKNNWNNPITRAKMTKGSQDYWSKPESRK